MRLLLLVAFIDEYASGMPVAGAAGLMGALGLSTTDYALAVFTVPALLGALVETPLLALSDRYPRARPWLVSAGLAGLAVALCIEACAGSAVVLALGVALFFPCSGLACGLAESMLVAASPEQAERRMAQWSLLGEAGDIATPLVLFGLSCWSIGFAPTLLGSALAIVLLALPLLGVEDRGGATADSRAADEEDEAAPTGVATALRSASTNARLMGWLLGSALCSLLDETLSALTTIFATARHGGGAAAAMLVSFSLGAALGLSLLDRLLRRRDALAVLLASSIACAVAFACFLLAPTVALATSACLAVGIAAAPLYPIAKAQAYRALPGQPGTVNAVANAFLPIDLLSPVLLGIAADRHGIGLALAALMLQPVGLALLAARGLRARRDEV